MFTPTEGMPSGTQMANCAPRSCWHEDWIFARLGVAFCEASACGTTWPSLGRLAKKGKLCFVTDGSSFAPDHYNCLKKTIDFYEHLYEALRLPTAIRTRIYRENALTLIGSSA